MHDQKLKKKQIDLKELQKKIIILKKKQKIIGLCHGVFDLIHIGHIDHFKEAKKVCDILIVSVTDDKFVNKGPKKPVFNCQQRVDFLSSLEMINYVIPSNYPTAVNIINTIKPNYYFKGPDYKDKKKDKTKNIIIENDVVNKNGGVTFYTRSKKYSSSEILNQNNNYLFKEDVSLRSKIRNKYSSLTINKIFEDMLNTKPLIIGELIIDQYNFCETLGKSGKDSFLVLRDLYIENYLGGSAAICCHISSFVKKVNFLSIIGEKKENLNFILKKLPKNINFKFVNKKNSPTIIKKRFLDNVTKSKLLGVYSLEDNLLENSDEKKLYKKFKNFVKKSNLVIISDYGHGMISPNFINKIKKTNLFIAVNAQLNAANLGYHTLKNYYKVDLVVVNESEMRHEMRSRNENLNILMKKLSVQLMCNYLVVTRGNQGLIMFDRINNKFYSCGAYANFVVDKTGAGDALLSILALCIFNKVDINLSLLIASFAAAKAVQTIGNKEYIERGLLIKELEHFLI